MSQSYRNTNLEFLNDCYCNSVLITDCLKHNEYNMLFIWSEGTDIKRLTRQKLLLGEKGTSGTKK